MNSPGPLRKVI